jgi:vacuolar protein sorting-associated protein 26
MFGFFSPNPSIAITINGNKALEQYRDRVLGTKEPIYTQNDKVTGTLEIVPPPGKTVTHQGIYLMLIGEFHRTDGETISRFFTRKQELVPAGELRTTIKSEYTFDNIQFPTATFKGTAVNVYYAIQICVVHRIIDHKQEQPFTVVLFHPPVEPRSIHNEVGIRNVLHIEFVFPREKIDCMEPLVGAVYFILIRLRIIHMALTLYRVENFSSDDVFIKKKTELKTIEIMDGAPCRGDNIPIRFFISEAGIYPFVSFRGSNLKVEHYVRAVLTDENGKNYFKRLKVEFARFKPEYVILEGSK